MQRLNGTAGRRRPPTPLNRRTELLAAFERSGQSVAAFARQHGIGYTTFCGWRQRRTQAKPEPAFVQVELSAPPPPVELVIELGGQSRVRLTSANQLDLAARLLHRLNCCELCWRRRFDRSGAVGILATWPR